MLFLFIFYFYIFFFFNDTATTEIYTLSLHDALPIPILIVWPCSCAAAGALQPPSRLTPNTIFARDRKSTRLNSSHLVISYAVFCLKKKKNKYTLVFLNKKKKITTKKL